jgi:general secretion pathway protein G
LVEILIVVVILGILAAIVIPQFTEASTEAKVARAASDLQMLRSQIELYKVQHNDTPPPFDYFEAALTKCSAADASAEDDFEDRTLDNRDTHPYGPYMHKIPINPFRNSKNVVPGEDDGSAGWVYDETTGAIYLANDRDKDDIPDVVDPDQ